MFQLFVCYEYILDMLNDLISSSFSRLQDRISSIFVVFFLIYKI